MTTTRTTTDAEGNTTVTTHGVMRSDDYQQSGIEVQRGFGRATVASSELLQDTDLITVNGVQMPVSAAREIGLVGTTATPNPQPAQPTDASPSEPERVSMGHEGYDKIAADLQTRVEAGELECSEASEYDLAVATVACADMTITEVVEVIDGINSGELNALDVDANTRQVAQSVEQRVTQSATKSAISELGQQGFDRLSQLAAASPVVDQAIRQYVSMRALGRSSDTWADFLEMAEDEMAGRA